MTIAIAVQIVLGLLGTGIGMSLVDPVNGSTPSASGFGIGAGLWWVVSTIVALGAGSYAASRIAGLTDIDRPKLMKKPRSYLLSIGAANPTRVTLVGQRGKDYLAALPPLTGAVTDPAAADMPGRDIGERPIKKN